MIVYSLLDDNIEGEKFRNFIACCLEHSTLFSLTFHNMNKERNQQSIQDLNEFYYKSFKTNLWYCYKALDKPIDVALYHSNSNLLDSIMTCFDRLFPTQLQGMEDICFFNDDSLLLGSVSHEGIAQLFLSSESELSVFTKFARWEKVSLIPKDYDYLPDLKKII